MNEGRKFKGTHLWYKDVQRNSAHQQGVIEVGVSIMTLDEQNQIKNNKNTSPPPQNLYMCSMLI